MSTNTSQTWIRRLKRMLFISMFAVSVSSCQNQVVGPPAEVTGTTIEEQFSSVSWYATEILNTGYGDVIEEIPGYRYLVRFYPVAGELEYMVISPTSNGRDPLKEARKNPCIIRGKRIYMLQGPNGVSMSKYDSIVALTSTQLVTISKQDPTVAPINPTVHPVRRTYKAMPRDYRLW
jgi:hypothetical protein